MCVCVQEPIQAHNKTTKPVCVQLVRTSVNQCRQTIEVNTHFMNFQLALISSRFMKKGWRGDESLSTQEEGGLYCIRKRDHFLCWRPGVGSESNFKSKGGMKSFFLYNPLYDLVVQISKLFSILMLQDRNFQWTKQPLNGYV